MNGRVVSDEACGEGDDAGCRIVVIGCTGVVGRKVLDVCRFLRGRFRIVGLTAGGQVSSLAEFAHEFGVSWVMCRDVAALRSQPLPSGTGVLPNEDALCELVSSDGVDMVVCAASGTSGLRPVLSALRAGKRVALASKEILVMAGEAVTAAASSGGGTLLPVDSEHCAIFQCLSGVERSHVRTLLLTASGGPFLRRAREEFEGITVEEALAHPVWKMGRKITVDSATMMNKGLELIEARWLFGLEEAQIDVVVHPQSIVHSMIELVDSSVLAQLACPDMALPIQYCLTYPERMASLCPRMDFRQTMTLTFEAPDLEKYPALGLARRVLQGTGRPLGAVFNAANEVAVEAFLQGRLTFGGIPRLVERTLDACGDLRGTSLEAVLDADGTARRIAEGYV